MSQKAITMEQLKQILQLQSDGISIREIARRVGISRNSVRKYLSRLSFGAAAPKDNRELAQSAYNRAEPDYSVNRLEKLIAYFKTTETELSKTGVTRQLLWQEYMDLHPDGYGYSQYCFHLQNWLKHTDLSMHLEYSPADMIMVDFAGKKQQYVDTQTGELIECEIFVAVLPFSGLIFCHAVHTQQTADFTECINTMLKYYGGTPATILCDNLRTAVKRASRYEPQFTDLCNHLADHYGTTFSATRPYSPRDKAMVEKAVSIVYRHIYAPLRHR